MQGHECSTGVSPFATIHRASPFQHFNIFLWWERPFDAHKPSLTFIFVSGDTVSTIQSFPVLLISMRTLTINMVSRASNLPVADTRATVARETSFQQREIFTRTELGFLCPLNPLSCTALCGAGPAETGGHSSSAFSAPGPQVDWVRLQSHCGLSITPTAVVPPGRLCARLSRYLCQLWGLWSGALKANERAGETQIKSACESSSNPFCTC